MDNLKKESDFSVASMFDSIAFRYDFLNHLLSFGTDRFWRKKAVRTISGKYLKPEILDVATGTGDLALAAMKLDPVHITGIDVSDKMLEIGREKIRKKELSEKIDLYKGDSEAIPFSDNTFDIVMVAFGVRNFSDPLRGLREMKRVMKQGGSVMVLEFSKPTRFPFKQVYTFYFHRMLPLIGRLLSHDRKAYRYLPDSVMNFPDNEEFIKLIGSAGFDAINLKRLTGGVASIYSGIKPNVQ